MTRGTLHEAVTDRLPLVPEGIKARILASPRTEEQHLAFMDEIPALSAVEAGGAGTVDVLPARFNVVAWNIERCLFPQASAAHLSPQNPDVVLLSEVDYGMARTAQRHTTAQVAAALNMHFAFGVEFFELGLGGPTELSYCTDDFNTVGWHGNAVLSKAPPLKTALLRLDDHGHWFTAPKADPKQPRVGGRMAIAALLPTQNGPVTVVSTHLESNTGIEHRNGQMVRLIDMLETFSEGAPVLIGGDLNSGNHLDDSDWQRELLFDTARLAGFSWDTNAEGLTTSPSLISPHLTRKMKLDWFATRHLTGSDAALLSNLDQDGTPLSDHLPIFARFTG